MMNRGTTTFDHSDLFCDLCGTTLSFSAHHATCLHCNSERSVKGKKKDLIKRLEIEPLILPESLIFAHEDDEEPQQLAMVNEACPKCENPQLGYYTRQLRSLDEGQTVFYQCPKCEHRFSTNT